MPEVAEHLDGVEPIEKVCFSAVQAEGFSRALQEARRDQVLLCGIESHVCVNQTAEDLLADGVEVHVAQDAVTSRTADNRALGLHKMERSGATVTSVETALFELLRAGRHAGVQGSAGAGQVTRPTCSSRTARGSTATPSAPPVPRSARSSSTRR